MHISELLSGFSKPQLKKIADIWGVPKTQSSRMPADEIIRLLTQFYSGDRLAGKLKQLPSEELDCLIFLSALFQPLSEGVERNEVQGKLRHTKNKKQIIDRLICKGLLFSIERYWSPYLVLPDEIMIALNMAEAAILARKIGGEKPAAGKVQLTENHGLAAHHDLLSLLSCVAHEKAEVTQQGYIYKRTMKRISDKFRLTEELFPGQFQELPAHFVFFEDFAEQYGLVSLDTHVAEINLKALDNFMHVSYAEWSRELYQYYLGYIRMNNSLIPLALIRLVFSLLGKNEWVPTNRIIKLINVWCDQWNIVIEEQLVDQVFYRPFILFGLIETGKDAENQQVWRWTDWGKKFDERTVLSPSDWERQDLLTEDLYVQPNLEIMVPENILPAIRWRVETFAELKKSDAVLIYELSQSRVEQAVEAGWDFKQIQSFLERYSKNPVAPNVFRTIQDWIGNFGKAKLWDVRVLEVTDEALAETLKSHSKIAGLFVGSFSQNTFIIRRRDEKQLRGMMKAIGFPVARRLFSPDEPSDAPALNGNYKEMEKNMQSFAPDTFGSAFKKDVVSTSVLVMDPEDDQSVEDDLLF